MIPEGRFQCVCCDYYTVVDRHSFEVCQVCYWEDDGSTMAQLDQESRSNHMTLRAARKSFEAIGAIDQSAVSLVASASGRASLRRELRATYH
jgi:hypothetical protein